MIRELTWLPAVLKNAGLKVATVDGWEERGSTMGTVLGVLCHHTAGPKGGNMPSLNTLVKGTSRIPGPLAQLGLGRDGTFYIIAAGRCNHAGSGIWKGITNGNTHFIGIEAENTGLANDFPWPEVQIDAYCRGVAAILKHIDKDASFCAGHKEYRLPKGFKTDPDFDMDEFRRRVTDILNGNTPPVLIPEEEQANPDGSPGRKTIRRGDTGELVRIMQSKLGLTQDGVFGPKTEAAVRQFQRDHQLVPDGIVGPKSWKAFDAAPAPAQPQPA
ncbi:peptidoglycan recognition protein family protein [Chitinophaga ginsengisoli]|uniref:Putative peptidoglycan binding protein n=1 Tax=Chitinophaga ginsengisoli TaxID=363837 RepID=A0A2P8FRV9_9BACT|nr:N-acetylmuramoyl-L-alanine amidase [Chitinophaga ginsengisoli]PSL24460.1 putative peptidoglycan binding protein [Chitinophaga ginsengisoli]